jgi:O-antigen ligase
VSATFLGLAGLAATGIACLVGDRRRTVRALGAAALAAAILGISVFASRGSLVATVAALACCLLAAAVRRSNWRTPLAIAVGVLALAALLLPGTPIWRKATASISRDVAALPEDRPISFMDAYRVANPARAALHSWTAERIADRPMAGHGARTWPADRARWKAEADRADPPAATNAAKPARRPKSPPRPPDSAHSLYLEAAYEYGAVGVLLLAGTLAALGRAAVRAGPGVRASAALALVTMTAVIGLGDLVLNSRPMAARMAAMFALAACARLPSSTQCTRP